MGIDTTQLKTNLDGLKEALPRDAQGTLGQKLEIALTGLGKLETGADLSLREGMDAAYKARNLIRLMISGISIYDERLVQIADDSLMGTESLGIKPELIEGLAKSLYEAKKTKSGETIAITGAKRNIEILEAIARLCIADGVNFVIDVSNGDIDAVMINNADDGGLQRLGEERVKLYEPVKTKLEARSASSAQLDTAQNVKYAKALGPYYKRLGNDDLTFSLTIIPTENDAKMDGMEYDDYMRLFFEACDQPWEEICKAQAILIEKLDAGKELHITNDDATDLTLNIEGFTFINSGADANIPGSEIFSAPTKEGVNGTLVSKGCFKYGNFPMVEDIVLIFENGKIVAAHAKEGMETLEQILNTDEGVRYLGEIAFGTNPHLRRHSINPLLVEKIAGSFHIAAGHAYKRKEDKGKPVNVYNGNESGVHWDITTLLRGKGGKVSLDGQLIQDNG
ncbi:MAG: aminopeptidase, partial [Patescibacteria group bacterium]